MVTVTFITNAMKIVTAPEDSNLLRISLREKGGIPFKCGAGLCGTCRCRIEQGLEHTDAVKARERKHLSEADLASGYRMACQTFINGDVSVSWSTDRAAIPSRKIPHEDRVEAGADGSPPDGRGGDC